jgi:hypothetical protein
MEVKMEKIKLNFKMVLDSGKFLLRLMEKNNVPHLMSIKDIPYVVVPEAVKFYPHLKKLIPTPIGDPENPILTANDFNNYLITPALPMTKIVITSNGTHVSSIDLYTGYNSSVLGYFSDLCSKGILYNYVHLKEILPFNFETNSDPELHRYAIYRVDNVVKASTLILTFLYVLSIRLTSGFDSPDFITQYIEALAEKLKPLGNDLVKIVNNLYLLKHFLDV